MENGPASAGGLRPRGRGIQSPVVRARGNLAARAALRRGLARPDADPPTGAAVAVEMPPAGEPWLGRNLNLLSFSETAWILAYSVSSCAAHLRVTRRALDGPHYILRGVAALDGRRGLRGRRGSSGINPRRSGRGGDQQSRKQRSRRGTTTTRGGALAQRHHPQHRLSPAHPSTQARRLLVM